MLLMPDHASEIVGQAARNGKNGQHLQEVGKRSRVFIGMGGVGIGKTAAVGAQHLDGNLRSHGPLGNGLRSAAFQGVHRNRGRKVLDHPLRDQEQSKHQAERKQEIETGAREVQSRNFPTVLALSRAMPARVPPPPQCR